MDKNLNKIYDYVNHIHIKLQMTGRLDQERIMGRVSWQSSPWRCFFYHYLRKIVLNFLSLYHLYQQIVFIFSGVNKYNLRCIYT